MSSYHIEKLAKDFKIVRQALGMSLEEVSDELSGMPKSTLSRVENGKPVDFETGKRIESWVRCADVHRFWMHIGAMGHIQRGEDIPENLVCKIADESEVEGCEHWVQFVQVVHSGQSTSQASPEGEGK